MVTTFAFIDPEIVEDIDPARVGTRLPIAARYTSSVWTRYNLIDDPDETLGVSLGVFVQGDRTALDGLLVPSYTRVDSGLYYRQGNITYRLLAENLLDERYIAGVSSSLFPGAPFNVRGAISWEY